MSMEVIFESGVDRAELERSLGRGVDQGCNPIEPFVADDDGWSMRCCLTDCTAGERIAIVAWSPFPWDGPYRETGPVVVHADGCDGFVPSAQLPDAIDARPMVLRPYGRDRRIVYHRVREVTADESVAEHVREILRYDDVAFVHARNTTGGCFAFSARRGT